MAAEHPARPLTGEEMVTLAKRHTLFEWSAQETVDPIPVAGAKGCYFWTPEGKRYLDRLPRVTRDAERTLEETVPVQ